MSMSRVFKGILVAGAVFFGLFVLSLIIALSNSPLIGGDKIAIVEIKGVITDPKEINDRLISMGERKDVKAIVLRIDSPGGGVAASQEVYEEIKKITKKKKVVASMGSVAASGGYYIAVATDKIVANPGTITGSIGVLMEFADLHEILEKIGIKGYVIKSGRFKDTGSPFRSMEKDEKKLLMALVKDVYDQFVQVVAENRGIDRKKVERIADGRIFTGRSALKMGYVDKLGNFQDAVSLAASMTNIKGKPTLVYPEKKGIIDIFLGANIKGLIESLSGIISVFSGAIYHAPAYILK